NPGLLLLAAQSPVDNFLFSFTNNPLGSLPPATKPCTSRQLPVHHLWVNARPKLLHGLSTLSCQSSQQIQLIFVDPLVAFPERGDSPAGMQYRGVIPPAESIPDFRQAVVRQFLGQSHGQLPGPRDGPAATLR